MGKLIGLIGLIAAAWVIYDLWTKNKRLSDTEKLVWTIAAVVFNILTAVIYYFTQKQKKYWFYLLDNQFFDEFPRIIFKLRLAFLNN